MISTAAEQRTCVKRCVSASIISYRREKMARCRAVDEYTSRANKTMSTCGGSGLLSKDAGEVSVMAS